MRFKFFNKKNKDIIDFTELQKRGLLQKHDEAMRKTVDSEGYKDFSGNVANPFSGTSSDSSLESSSSSESSGIPGFGFLGNLASSATSTPIKSFDASTGEPIPEQDKKRKLARRIRLMNEKIEENETKIFQLEKRLENLEGR